MKEKNIKEYIIENYYGNVKPVVSIRKINADNDILGNLEDFIQHCFNRVPELKEIHIKFKRDT